MDLIEQHEIGYTARLIDDLPIKKRMKMREATMKKIVEAIILYFMIMMLFSTLL